jgi:hypothetical protein
MPKKWGQASALSACTYVGAAREAIAVAHEIWWPVTKLGSYAGGPTIFSGGFDQCLDASREREGCWGAGRELLRPPSVHQSPNQSV